MRGDEGRIGDAGEAGISVFFGVLGAQRSDRPYDLVRDVNWHRQSGKRAS
jgi:hypothetical protein